MSKKSGLGLERESAQARALKQKQEYILPVRSDDTPVPGLNSTVGYIDLRSTPVPRLVDIIIEKLADD
jgi:hypothetical protein